MVMTAEAAGRAARPLEVVIVDVGHGNCAVVRDGTKSAIVDLPRAKPVVSAIIDNKCDQVEHLLLSHPDEDHIGGAARLLADPDVSIKNFWCNPSAIQDTDTYLDLLEQAALREEGRQTRYRSGLNVGAREDLYFERVEIEVLHPDVRFAGIGQASSKHKKGEIPSNRMSAVLKVSLAGKPAVLLAADIDDKGFEAIVSRGVDLEAPVLVFPHHGGSAKGGDDRAFARRVCEQVKPKLVVFSLGRHKYKNPLAEVLAGVRDASPAAHIACTQLSKNCHSRDCASGVSGHLSPVWPSAGGAKGESCAGTVVVRATDAGEISYLPTQSQHHQFVIQNVDAPKCLDVTA
ncbi:MBL fold metallo-hydrolase [Streptomyces sp. NPDC051098]|uniref:ComEC/Rec2 family competence protein n=1 Tax=Streptomyces sp. NPDC051098 TaxID=3155411 RepID=UPI0034385041